MCSGRVIKYPFRGIILINNCKVWNLEVVRDYRYYWGNIMWGTKGVGAIWKT